MSKIPLEDYIELDVYEIINKKSEQEDLFDVIHQLKDKGESIYGQEYTEMFKATLKKEFDFDPDILFKGKAYFTNYISNMENEVVEYVKSDRPEFKSKINEYVEVQNLPVEEVLSKIHNLIDEKVEAYPTKDHLHIENVKIGYHYMIKDIFMENQSNEIKKMVRNAGIPIDGDFEILGDVDLGDGNQGFAIQVELPIDEGE